MSATKNILFIMCDQLRFDYLGCYGHPHLKTPNIDALAARGLRFTNAYVQSPVCGSSRMSFYTSAAHASARKSAAGWPLCASPEREWRQSAAPRHGASSDGKTAVRSAG